MRAPHVLAGALAALVAVLVSPPGAQGALRHVPADYPTIQAGIDACAPGDTVLVAPGAYVENIHYRAGDITVASHYLTTGDPAWITGTLIQAAAFGLPVVTIAGGQSRAARLCGFTITGGMGGLGSGVHCVGSSPTIDHNRITNNCPRDAGGGIYVALGSPLIEHNSIFGN